jgi:ubiquinone/menaquinone biosynthesis C-methylase UbiE
MRQKMRPKSIGISREEFKALSATEAELVARAVSSVVDQALPASYDQRLALISAGDTDAERYKYVGLEWLEFFIRYGRLSPSDRILDIGCGAGRMALPLSCYLGDQGMYCGFDVTKDSIEYCMKVILKENFRFQHIDLRHHLYNKDGLIDGEAFVFPYLADFFDLSFAASVFTHLDLKTAASYLGEICRVLKPGGVAILSMFAIPEAEMQPVGGVTSLLGAGEGEYSYRFKNRGQGFYTHCDETGRPKNHYMSDDVGDPVAYERIAFEGLCKKAGLKTVEFLSGAWRCTGYKYGWQDMFILQK